MTKIEFQKLLSDYEQAAREVGAYKGPTADGPYDHRLRPMQELRERLIAAWNARAAPEERKSNDGE